MKTLISISVIVTAAVVWCGVLLSPTSAQRRAKAFSHSTPKHKDGQYANCNVCHQLPTSNWASPRSDKLPPFPDVTTYPDPHAARNVCFACHAEFSRTDVICGTCHTNPVMAGKLYPFPDRRRARQFDTIFPHDAHQDLIASNRTRTSDVAVAHFVPASFAREPPKPAEDFYNCAVCHKTPTVALKFAPRPLPLLKPLGNIVADKFDSPVNSAFFKTSPEGHASCFNCHYKNQYLPEGKQNCSGCHELTKPYAEQKTLLRYSIKFDHERTEHIRDCASCHIRISQNADVKLLKDADVPISTCFGCHAKSEGGRYAEILSIELAARDASIAKKESQTFQCTYCHTSAIGRFDVPTTHRKP